MKLDIRTILLALAVFLIVFSVANCALGDTCEEGATCVPKEDMTAFVELLKEKQCLQTTQPKFELDDIKIFVDQEGRVFYSGDMPHPYSLTMDWCGYKVEAEGKVNAYAGLTEPPVWGFRFRPKMYFSFLLAEPFYEAPKGEDNPGFEDVWDAGFLVDFLYYDFVNLNVAAGWRSFGGGVGFDLTANFGAYVGYALTWGDWQHNPNAGVYFGF